MRPVNNIEQYTIIADEVSQISALVGKLKFERKHDE